MLHFKMTDHWKPELKMLVQNINPGMPYEAQVGDFGEYTGLTLAWCAINKKYQGLCEQIFDGLVAMLETTGNQLIPRGWYFGANDPEPTKKRWIKIGDKQLRILDMNQTQTWYLFYGVWVYMTLIGSEKAARLLHGPFERIADNGGKIKYNDKVTKQGHFFKHHFKEWYAKPFEYLPIGNMYPRGLSLFRGLDEPLFSLRTAFAMATVNWWGRLKRMNDTDKNNTSFALWLLAQVDNKYEKKYIRWEKKMDSNMAFLKGLYDSNSPTNADCMQNEYKYLLRLDMRRQYGI